MLWTNDVEELYVALKNLYYDSEVMKDGESYKIHHIALYYIDYGTLTGCELVRKNDRKVLDKWYPNDKIVKSEPFDWSQLPFNGNGCLPSGSGW